MVERVTVTGAEIRRAREARKMSQRELAEALGVTETTVSNWETGRTSKPRFRSAELVKFLGLDKKPPPEVRDPRVSEATAVELVAALVKIVGGVPANGDAQPPDRGAPERPPGT